MNFCFWWYSASGELASDDVITSGALSLQEHYWTSGAVLLQMLPSFRFVKIFALFCSYITYNWSQIYCLWSCTLEQILAYPINNFLILCYHSKRVTIWQGILHCFDNEENVSRWLRRDTIWWIPNLVSCYTSENVSWFTKNVTRFWWNYEPI